MIRRFVTSMGVVVLAAFAITPLAHADETDTCAGSELTATDEASLYAAFSSAVGGGTVTLCASFEVPNSQLQVSSGTVTLDLNGFELEVSGAVHHAGIEAPQGTTLIVKDSSTDSTGRLTATGGSGSAGLGGSYDIPSGTVQIESGTIEAKGGCLASSSWQDFLVFEVGDGRVGQARVHL